MSKALQTLRLTLLLLCLLPAAATAQTTRVRGQVTDAGTGDPLPYVGLFYKGTSIGITADAEGRYVLETRDTCARVLVCHLLGYDTQEMLIKPGVFTQADFALKQHETRLSGASVKADNRKAKRMLAAIDAHRDRNDPEQKPCYSADVYTKVELDLSNPRQQLRDLKMMDELQFVYDYIDTSAVTGKSYLPMMLSESVVHRLHTSKPDADAEEILANRVSGINPDGNILAQFTGTLHLKVNFYRAYVNCFGVEFPSPMQAGGMAYYNYFIVDSLQMDGRKTYCVRYHPRKGISSPAFDGEMRIDADDYALRSIHAKMKHGGNVNWVRDIVLDVEYDRLPDSTWFYRRNDIAADFSLVLADSTHTMSVLATRKMDYTGVSYEPIEPIDKSKSIVTVSPDAESKDEAWWAAARPYQLSSKEEGIYGMVDRVKEQRIYTVIFKAVAAIVNGYLDFGPIGFGPVLKIVSANNLEGFRMRLGIHTSNDLSKKWRWTGYVAYGCRDHEFKGGLSYEHVFSKEPTSKLTLDAHYDVTQLGRGTSRFTMDNLLSSIWHGQQKLCPMSDFSALYEHEFNIGFNATASAALKRWYGNGFVPMVTPSGEVLQSVASNELHLQTRFSRDETVNRGHFVKQYVHTNYPVVMVDLTGSVPGLRQGDWGFFRPELTVDWKINIPPLGRSRFNATAGTIFGQVPYPLLHMFPGNATNIYDKTAFACVDYLEFAADTWAQVFWEHDFHGFFLGKIPLLRELQLREAFTLKAAYGTLRDYNNPLVPGSSAPMLFPQGMAPMGSVPYMEIGAGVTNIFRVLRIDCFWRLTHREEPSRNFKVMLRTDFSF